MSSLERIGRAPQVKFAQYGQTILEGMLVFGRLEAGFVASSGIRAAFLLTGVDAEDGFSLGGRGTVSVHGVELPVTIVTASGAGLQLEFELVWRKQRKLVRLERPGADSLWTGAVRFDEELRFSVTPRPPLEITVAIEVGPDGVAVHAAGSLSGLSCEIVVNGGPGASLQMSVASARRDLIVSLQRQVEKEIEQLEEDLATWDNLRALPSLDPDSLADAPAPVSQRPPQNGSTVRVAPAGYLARPASPGRGYLGVAKAANPGRGYLPLRGASPGGYLSGRGYLAARSGPAPAMRPAPSAAVAPSLPPLRESSISALVLCKDLLHALEGAGREE